MIKSSRLSAIFLCILALTMPFTAAQGAYLKNGVLNFAIGEKEDPAQSNTYVKVVKRPDGSAQVFYYDPDAGNKFVQKTIPAGQTLKISYWNSSGQRIKQEIRTSGEAAAPEIASTTKAQARPQATPKPKELTDSNTLAAKSDFDSDSPSTPIGTPQSATSSSASSASSAPEKDAKTGVVDRASSAPPKTDNDQQSKPLPITPTTISNLAGSQNQAEGNPTRNSSNTAAGDSSKVGSPKEGEVPATTSNNAGAYNSSSTSTNAPSSNSASASNSTATNQPLPETKQTQNTAGATLSGITGASQVDDSDPFSDGESAPQLTKPESAPPASASTSASTPGSASALTPAAQPTLASPSAAPATPQPELDSASLSTRTSAPAATPITEPGSTATSSAAAEPTSTSASGAEPAGVASADLPKFDPFALVPTMKSSPADTAAASPGSSSKAIITPIATTGDSFIKATDTDLGPCVWRKFPIKVYMDPAPGPTAAQLEAEVREAFDIWTKVTGNKIRFEFGAKQGADITITWTPTTAGFRNPSEAGESSVDYSTPPGPKRTWDNPGSITHAKVKLSTTDIHHKEWQAGQFKLLVLHEIGHALGIFGHSDNANDIMYTLKGAPALSPRDINTVNILYKSVSGN